MHLLKKILTHSGRKALESPCHGIPGLFSINKQHFAVFGQRPEVVVDIEFKGVDDDAEGAEGGDGGGWPVMKGRRKFVVGFG